MHMMQIVPIRKTSIAVIATTAMLPIIIGIHWVKGDDITSSALL